MLVVFFRAIFLYVLIMFSIRLMGKRQLGELQPSELVITILISNIASLPIEDTNIPMILGVIPVLILVSFDILISNISLKSKGFRSFISGSPMIIIHDGLIDQKQLRKLRFSIDDLMESLRQSGIFDVQDVEYAIVETTGKVSVLQKFDAQSVTPKTLNIPGTSKSPPVVVISDGKVIESALAVYDIKEDWVIQTILMKKYALKKVFLMTCDKELNYYIVEKNM
ncbi:MAG: DUF421 domain-containing protein [Oscillospiraceae bacterium]